MKNPCDARNSIESQLWFYDQTRLEKIIPLESEIVDHLPSSDNYTTPKESSRHNNKADFPGFIRYTQFSKNSPKTRRDVAYRCGACRMVILGPPEIATSPKFPDSLIYSCSFCSSDIDIFDGKKDNPLDV